MNGKKVTPHYVLREGDEVEIKTAKAIKPSPKSTSNNPLLFPIVYEDKNYLILDKPAGLVVHPGSGHKGKGDTLSEILAHHVGTLSIAGGEERPGIVHRLDKDTSGVMVIAKTNTAHRWLTQQFADKKVKKEYIALIHGHLEPKEGSIEAPLTRSQTNRTKIQVAAGKKSRYALTHYRVLKQFEKPFSASLVEVRIETGRTHQIRVHFEAIAHSLVGDPIYTSRAERGLSSAFLPLPYQFLHAQKLEFTSPTTKKTVKYSAKLPKILEETLKQFN